MKRDCTNLMPRFRFSSVIMPLILPMHILNKRARQIEQYYDGFVRMEGLETKRKTPQKMSTLVVIVAVAVAVAVAVVVVAVAAAAAAAAAVVVVVVVEGMETMHTLL